MTSEDDEEESELEEIRRITQIIKRPDNNDHQGIKMKRNGKSKNSPRTLTARSPSCQKIQQYARRTTSNR